MDDDFINWTPEHCKRNIHIYQKTKAEEMFALLLARYDRFLIKLARNFYKQFCGRVPFEDLHHSAIIGFGNAMAHFRQEAPSRLIMAEIKAYVKSELNARYMNSVRFNPAGLMEDQKDEQNSETLLETLVRAYFIMSADFLSKNDTDLLDMKFYQGIKFKEIGQKFGITEQGAAQRYKKIIAKIRKKIKSSE